MTTTRINHTGHNHPNTTAARTACRKALRTATPAPAPKFDLVAVGNGKVRHAAVMADGVCVAARCGAGMQRGLRKSSTLHHFTSVTNDVNCNRCR